MEPAKLQFSNHEMKLVSSAEWILTKNEILNKIGAMLGELNIIQKGILTNLSQPLPEEIISTTPKISRGENYKGLPYLVLDYPRLFKKDNIFAIRSMFWWGRTLSTTLHFSGKWKQHFAERILHNYEFLAQHNFLIATESNEWAHDVTGADYRSAKDFNKDELQKMLSDKSFFKPALFVPVDKLNEGAEILEEQFKKIIALL